MARKMLTSRQYVRMREMWRDGVKIKVIAKEIGCSAVTVGNVANAHREDFPRRNHKTTEEDVRTMMAMRSEGASIASIARVVGCNRWTVRRRLERCS